MADAERILDECRHIVIDDDDDDDSFPPTTVRSHLGPCIRTVRVLWPPLGGKDES